MSFIKLVSFAAFSFRYKSKSNKKSNTQKSVLQKNKTENYLRREKQNSDRIPLHGKRLFDFYQP